MQKITDQQMEVSIGRMLQVGVTVSAAVVVMGGILYLPHAGEGAPDYTQFHAERASLISVMGTLSGAMRLKAQSVIQLGILLLIATPVARVAYCVAGFARQRDKLYVAVSSLVLMILVYSLVRGGR